MTDRSLSALAMISGYALIIGLIDNFVVIIARDVGLWQFHASRSFVGLGILMLAAVVLGLRLRPRRPGAVLARSVIHAVGMLMYFGALAFLPVAQVAAGLFTAPIFVLLIERVFYGQRISAVQVLAVGLGFAGVVLVLGPSAMAGASLAATVPVLAGAFYAMGNVATRRWCEGEAAATLLGGFFLMLGVAGVIGMAVLTAMPLDAPAGPDGFVLRGPVVPDLAFWGWVLAQAVGSIIGVGLMIRAYQITDAGRASVFEYIILPASAFWSWVVWGETLAWLAWVGMALIAAAGALIALAGRRADPVPFNRPSPAASDGGRG